MDQVQAFCSQEFLIYDKEVNLGSLKPTAKGLAVIDSILSSII
jgi:hypothetical protein